MKKRWSNILYWFFAILGAIYLYRGTNAYALFGVLFLLLALQIANYHIKLEKESQ